MTVTLLVKKNADVKNDWTALHDAAMQKLKKKITTAPVLVCDDGTSQIELLTDASVKGIGAVLLLKLGGKSKPITFTS